MDKNTPLYKLLIFGVLIVIGMILASVGSMVPIVLEGITISEISENPDLLLDKLSASTMRLSLLINHVFLFILPAIIFGLIFYKREFLKGYLLGESPNIIHILLAIALLLAAYPLVNFAFYINAQIPLAEWMVSAEQDVAKTLEKILGDDNRFILIINILLIAVMPAIGEELVFRGVIQKYFAKIFKNPHIGVWLAAAIFSGIHLQFEGFLARMVLGAILGYIFYLTKNLWIPILIHFLNNLLPVIAFMVYGNDMTDTSAMTESVNWSLLIPSCIGVPIIIYLFLFYNGRNSKIRA